MKQTYVTTVGTFLLGLTLNSCIQEEAPNAEADITACSLLPVDCLASNTIEVGLPYSDELNAYPIEIKVKEGTDLSSLAPTFELTPGATISPESGSIHDFSSPVRYTVTSEDRQWHRTYRPRNSLHPTYRRYIILKMSRLRAIIMYSMNSRESIRLPGPAETEDMLWRSARLRLKIIRLHRMITDGTENA